MTRKLLADSNRAAIREIVESNTEWGTTPASGVSRGVRFTSSSIVVTKDTAMSDEIRSDRMVSSIIETGASSGGDLNFEFSAGNQDGALQRVLQGAWSRPMTFDVFRGEQVSISGTNEIKIAGGDFTGYFTTGRYVRTSGFVAPGNNVYALITGVAFAAGATTVTVSGTPFTVETGSAHTVVRDANDVVIHEDANIDLGVTDARTIDSNGTNAFAALVAAKQLVPGQIIFIEGVGYESGSVDLTGAVAGETLTINDGVNEITLVFDTDFTDGATLAAAINEARIDETLFASATAAAAVVTITNLNKTGGAITGDAGVITDFAGGNDTGGFYGLVSVSDDVLTVDRDIVTSVTGEPVTIKASMLRNPGDDTQITPQSITVETTYTDVDQSFISDGLRDGGFELDISSGAIITGSIKREGRETRRAARKLNKAPYTALDAPATENVSATNNVGALRAAGEELSTAIKSIKLSVDGALRKQTAVANKFPVGIAAGRLTINVTVEAYFADGSNFDAFINHDTRDLIFPIIDQDANTYYFTVPSFKITSDPIAPGGIDQDVMETMEGMAFRDAATACMLQVDRFSSTTPVGA
jgi:hypothetical protein